RPPRGGKKVTRTATINRNGPGASPAGMEHACMTSLDSSKPAPPRDQCQDLRLLQSARFQKERIEKAFCACLLPNTVCPLPKKTD
ncbi:MAG TPA: hypothetical protein VNM90_07910, partial [Haliangium sp.]|nr:hypothetical protein [Haliangium sp.]